MKIDPRILVQFVTIVREGSFSAASRQLAVAQPWLSARIRHLEEQLGVTLLVRGGRTVELTAEGVQLMQHASNVAEQLKAAEGCAARLRRAGEKRLRIGAPPHFQIFDIRRQIVQAFHDLHPNLVLEIDVGWSPMIIDLLKAGRIDIGFTIGEYDDYQGLERQLLDIVDVQLVLARSDLLAGRDILEPEDLRGRQIAVFARGPQPELYDNYCSRFAAAGAKLIEAPEHTLEQLESITKAGHIMLGGSNFASSNRFRSAMVAKPVRELGRVAFVLVRKQAETTRWADLFWRFASEYAQNAGEQRRGAKTAPNPGEPIQYSTNSAIAG